MGNQWNEKTSSTVENFFHYDSKLLFTALSRDCMILWNIYQFQIVSSDCKFIQLKLK